MPARRAHSRRRTTLLGLCTGQSCELVLLDQVKMAVLRNGRFGLLVPEALHQFHEVAEPLFLFLFQVASDRVDLQDPPDDSHQLLDRFPIIVFKQNRTSLMSYRDTREALYASYNPLGEAKP